MKGIGDGHLVRKALGADRWISCGPFPGDALGPMREASTWTVTKPYDKSYVQTTTWTHRRVEITLPRQVLEGFKRRRRFNWVLEKKFANEGAEREGVAFHVQETICYKAQRPGKQWCARRGSKNVCWGWRFHARRGYEKTVEEGELEPNHRGQGGVYF